MRYVKTAHLTGVEAALAMVSVNIRKGGLPVFTVEGLSEAARRETLVRVRSAIKNQGFVFPGGCVEVVIDRESAGPVSGSGFDLPIALGILAETGVVEVPKDAMFVGELSLGGDVRAVRGTFAMTELAMREGLDRIYLPGTYAHLAASAGPSGFVVSPDDLVGLVRHLNGEEFDTGIRHGVAMEGDRQDMLDMSDIRGCAKARRALEVAAAGGHNLLLIGGPGAGKTMLARRLTSILPPMTRDEQLEVTRVHDAAGLLRDESAIVSQRPFRAPHHSTTPAGLIGGGSGVPRPGEMALGHNGVLFLDELPEFSRATIECVRLPKDGKVTLARAWGEVTFPARTHLVAAMNPCPCSQRKGLCVCEPDQVKRYLSRIADVLPLFDMVVRVETPDLYALEQDEPGESSSFVRERVMSAREWLKGCTVVSPPGYEMERNRLGDVACSLAALDGCGPLMQRHYDEALTYMPKTVLG